MKIITILTIITLVIALATAQTDRNLRVTQFTGTTVSAARRSRKVGPRRSVCSKQVSGQVTDVREAHQRGANAFATALTDNRATVVYAGRSAMVFSSRHPAFDRLTNVLSGGALSKVTATGPVVSAHSASHEVFGVDSVLQDPGDVRFSGVDISGRADDGIDLFVSDGAVHEQHHTVEVPSTGYCIRCSDRVYRRDVVLVEIDRREGGVYYDEDPIYANATSGTCERCDATVMRFGRREREEVRVTDLRSGYVRPAPVAVRPKAGPAPKGALPHPHGYCMGCREVVDREEVSVTAYSNGRPATVGTCPYCEASVWRAGGPVLPDVVVHIQAAHTEEREAFCGDPRARVIGADRQDADDLFYLESLDHTLFVLACPMCELFELDQQVEMEENEQVRVAAHLAAGACPDDTDTSGRAVPVHNPVDYYRNIALRDGREEFVFTAYSGGREKAYTCYWYAPDCRQPAGWHGFRRVQGLGSDEYHLCSRHWRVAMGYSAE